MANNCLVTKLKEVVNNDNLEYLGFTKLIVDTTGRNDSVSIVCYGGTKPIGAFIVGEGTFTNGKKVIELGDNPQVGSGQVITVMVPKYEHPVRIGAADLVSSKGPFAMDIDGYEYQDKTQTQSPSDYNTYFQLYPTNGGYSFSGNVDNIAWQLNPEVIIGIQFGILPNITWNISESPYLYKLKKLTILRVERCPGVTGDVETFISAMMQENKEYFKARSGNNFAIFSDGANLTYGSTLSQITNYSVHYLKFYFSGSSTVDIKSTSNGTNFVSVATYDIDTDTFALV